jgi:AcrR family transcriptional regulator
MARVAVGERRATASDEKEARRKKILEAAAKLLRGWSFSDITMDRIADLAGVAKGTLYLYFRTKEALFLVLYEERLSAWYVELETLATRAGGTVKPPAAARVIASTLSARPLLIQLHGLLHSTLVRNIEVDSILDFRRRQRESLTSLASALAGRIDGLSYDHCLRFLIRLESVVGGLSWAAFPTPAVSRAFEEEDLEIYRIDFEEELTQIITALLE